MIAALFGDKTACQFNHIAPHHRRDQRTGMQRVGENRQTAERVIDPREVFFQMAANLGGRFQTRQHIDEAKQRHAQRLVRQRPVDHPAEQILRFKQRRLVPRRFLIQRPR